MPTYKLIYFNAMGVVEPARFLFALAGQEYEDVRIERENWPDLKKTLPLGQLPVLEVDGIKIAQSQAIFRYLARELGFYGGNALESAKIDTVIETLNDFITQARKYFFEKDEAKKAEFKKDLLEVQAPKYMKLLEVLLDLNTEGDGFFVGSKISLADVLVFYAFTDRFDSLQIEVTEPKLKALLEKIKAHPKMADWLNKRPKTQF